jgi:hypothetical protein
VTFAEMLGLGFVALSILTGGYFGRLAWLVEAQPGRKAGYALLAAVALVSPPILYFLFIFRDGLGPDAVLSTGSAALGRWVTDAWPVLIVSVILGAAGGYLVRRAV